MKKTDGNDLRHASLRLPDLRSASDARDTNAAYAAHEKTRIGVDPIAARCEVWYNRAMETRNAIYPDECYAIRGAIYEVYRELGNGFKEEVYQQCLEKEFAARRIPFDAKRELRIFYKGEPIDKTYIPDFMCFDKVIVEIKAVETLTREHRAQLMNYLRLTKCRLGLLVNFGAYPKAAIEQWVN